MAGGFESDPHSQDGQACPRNFFGITNYAELNEREVLLAGARAIELRSGRISGKFDLGHLRKIHWYLFQDVFPWAGELRVVGLAKVGGAPFAYPQFITSSLTQLFAELKAEELLVGMDRSVFARRGAYYWGELNAIHPFREGNGRTQREFLRQLAKDAGHTLSWAGLQQEENTVASILSHTRRDHSGLERLLLGNLRVPASKNGEVNRIVVKLGTNVIMRSDGKLALGLLCGLVESVAALRAQGVEVLLVSSGAVGLGVERLGLASRPSAVAEVQACAAVGQSRLMALYDDAFDRLGCRIAQVLLTEDDFVDPVRHANLRATLDSLLTLGVIPIVNENDTVSTIELDRPMESTPRERVFGDNDKLSALLLKHIDADLLVLLSDVDGLYDRPPGEPGAQLLHGVAQVDAEILALAHGGNARGRGGMLSKLESVRIVLEAGKQAVIANGRTPQVLERLLAGEDVGTRFGAMQRSESLEPSVA